MSGVDAPKSVDERVTAGTLRFAFRWERSFVRLARTFGITPDSCALDLSSEWLEARFGPWTVRTPVANVASAQVTGPYRWWKTAGPAHLSLGDLGLTFASTTAAGVCIQFHRPVRGGDPAGLLKHPSLTVTVADPDGLVAALEERRGAALAGSTVASPASVPGDSPPAVPGASPVGVPGGASSPLLDETGADELRRRLTQGALAGLAATAAMTPVMLLARRAFGDYASISPQAVTRRGLRAMALPQRWSSPATMMTHAGFGAGAGALFALLADRLPGPRLARGVTFALALMAASYEGWMPMTGAVAPLHRPPWGRSASVLASHLVYGAVLGKVMPAAS